MTRLLNPIMEEILIQLPMEDLLSCASEVCRQWRHLIYASPRIQEKLFKRVDVARGEDWMLPWTRNPLTEQWFEWHDNGIRGPIELISRHTLLRAPASWRDMFVAKPAPSIVILQFTRSLMIVHHRNGITIGRLVDILTGPRVAAQNQELMRVVLQ